MDFLEARDQGIWNGIQTLRRPWLDDIALGVTFLGHSLVLTLVVVLTLAVLCRQRRHWSVAWLAVAFVGGIGLLSAVRSLVERERPQIFRHPLEVPATTSSFPSERAFLATIVYLSVALVLGPQLSRKWRQRLLIAGGALAILIGISRLYIGVCYPTDVLAGWLGGLAWVLICQGAGERWIEP